jgi:uncharacterized membrane protein
MFELLFKYPPAAFAKGHLILASAWPVWALVAAIAIVAVGLALAIGSRLTHGATSLQRSRLTAIWGLESLLAAALLVLLWQPALAITELRPQQNIVAVLLDDSRSMDIAESGGTRFANAVRALESDLMAKLGDRFQVRVYRFDSRLTRVAKLEELARPAAAPATHIGASLSQLASETADLPLGAVVLLSDGGDNGGGVDSAAVAALRSRHVPVHTVGFGREQTPDDAEIEDVSVAPRALAGSRVSATFTIRQSGYAGEKATLAVRDGTKLLATRAITLGADGALQSEDLLFSLAGAGPRTLSFSLEPFASEKNRANNVVTRLVAVEAEPRRILYFEGEPRWEYKFIRRAEDGDPMVQLTSMLRTTENKIYRQGIRDPSELKDGFPTRAEDLDEFQGLVIGSVDAGYFTPVQQGLIRDFVDRRGGGLLLLGGRESLADGVWGGSLLADLLPVTLPGARQTFHRDHATVSLTRSGEDSVICRLIDDSAQNAEKWRKLPYLMDYQDPGVAKPGAVVLAEMRAGVRTMPLLVTQHYGRGRTAVLATGGTWRWQMSLPLGDKTHEEFWQQLLRWVADARGRVAASTPNPMLFDEGTVQLAADVRDKAYLSAPDARVGARILGPGGAAAEVELSPVPNEAGRFRAAWTAATPGVYVAEVTARRGAEELGRDVVAFQRLDGVMESFHTQQNRELLERLAASTGGRYWRPNEVGALARAIPYSAAGLTIERTEELWNMPVVFLALLALRGAEWLLRRRWGIV